MEVAVMSSLKTEGKRALWTGCKSNHQNAFANPVNLLWNRKLTLAT